jgi:hypothetical protein
MKKITGLDYDQLCQQYMNFLYEGITGFIQYTPGQKEQAQEQKIFMTYGEILYPGVNRLIESMTIGKNDVLYDLGSGVGKVPLQFLLKTPIKKACGVEAHTERHHAAEAVYKKVHEELPELFSSGRHLQSIYKNFLDVDFTDATILFIASSCYSDELLIDLGRMADHCPNLRYIISHKPLPNKMPFKGMIEIECTWDVEKTHFYAKE